MQQLGEHIPDREKGRDDGVEKQSIVCVHRTENSRWGAARNETGQMDGSQTMESFVG